MDVHHAQLSRDGALALVSYRHTVSIQTIINPVAHLQHTRSMRGHNVGASI